MEPRVLGVLGELTVLLKSDGSVVHVTQSKQGQSEKVVGHAREGLFADIEVRSCEGTMYGSCGNQGIVNASGAQERLVGQTYLSRGVFPWHGPGARWCCMGCSYPPR